MGNWGDLIITSTKKIKSKLISYYGCIVDIGTAFSFIYIVTKNLIENYNVHSLGKLDLKCSCWKVDRSVVNKCIHNGAICNFVYLFVCLQ